MDGLLLGAHFAGVIPPEQREWFPYGKVPEPTAYQVKCEAVLKDTKTSEDWKKKVPTIFDISDELSLQSQYTGLGVDPNNYKRQIANGRARNKHVDEQRRDVGEDPIRHLASPALPTCNFNVGGITGSRPGLEAVRGLHVDVHDEPYSHSFIYTFNERDTVSCMICNGNGVVVAVLMLRPSGDPIVVFFRAAAGDLIMIMARIMCHKVIRTCPFCGPRRISAVVFIHGNANSLGVGAYHQRFEGQAAEEKETNMEKFRLLLKRRGGASRERRQKEKDALRKVIKASANRKKQASLAALSEVDR
ncbi:hypothetical protein HDU93_006428 [Gonapodya sp. JEL0774]|nr:hypothetical protein HDU93_006428 [Gonapodya sp. JEL0774]